MKLIADFNDLLALLIIVAIIPGLWITDGLGLLKMNPEVLGSTIAAWTLVLQFYFRKRRGGD